MEQWERNRRRIDMVGSAHNPPPERTPLGTIIEEEPEWVCCCCDQDIPRPSGGFSTPIGSFCSECFVSYIEYLFNESSVGFLNAIRKESYDFIAVRREDLKFGVTPMPTPRATAVRDILRGERRRLMEKLQDLVCELNDDD
jgi:hypothetical protein